MNFTIAETAANLGVTTAQIYQLVRDQFLTTKQTERGTVIEAEQIVEYDRYRRLPRNEQKKARKKLLKIEGL